MTDFETDIEHCLEVLKQGGVILYPTDTIWGIGCDATNAAAVQKIYDIKNRPSSKSMIVLIADQRDIVKYVPNPDPRIFDFLTTTRKPTTVVYDAAIGLADNLLAEDGSVGIRLVEDNFCRHLIKRFRKPLVSTSANISGDPSPAKFVEIINDIVLKVDYVVQYRQDDNADRESSAVVKLNKNGSVTILRP